MSSNTPCDTQSSMGHACSSAMPRLSEISIGSPPPRAGYGNPYFGPDQRVWHARSHPSFRPRSLRDLSIASGPRDGFYSSLARIIL